MPRRAALLLAVSIVAAAVCVRLGVWQLQRLGERRALNAAVAARLREPAADPASLPTDTAAVRYRRVRVAGRADYAHEIVLAARSRDGSPGVNIVTPLRVAGRDTAVLVNRGWVYSPNGADVELTRWREPDSLLVDGFVEVPSRRPGAARLPSTPGAYRWLDAAALARDAGYPVTPWYVTVTRPPGARIDTATPVRLAPPPLDEGPHLSYAIQWFSFATIALVGGVLFVRSDGKGRVVPPHPQAGDGGAGVRRVG